MWCFYSHVPHHAISCPYKWQVSFQAPTVWVGVVVLFFLSNMQLKTLDSSKLFGFLWCLPKSIDTHTHTQRTTWLLANLFPHGFESWDGKMQRTLLWFYSVPSIWVLGAFWVYYKMGILKLITQIGFWFFRLLRAPQSHFFVYKLGLITCKNSLWRQSWWKKYNSNPVLTSFRYSFCSEKNRLRSGIL